MKNTKKLSFIILASTVGLVGAASLLATNDGLSSRAIAEGCQHSYGNHYAAKAATCTEAGYVEHWACCECHEVLLVQPGSGTWVNQSSLQYEMQSDNPAYVAPSHSYGSAAASTSAIGYYTQKCSACGDEKPTSTLMSNDDILIGKEGVNENIYGADADFVDAAGTQEGNSGYPYALAWSTGEALEEETIKLPKVNYAAYGIVVFRFGTSAASWGGSEIGIGVNAANDLISYASHGTQYTFKLIVNYADGALSVTSKVSDNTTATVTVSSDVAAIANGSKSLSLIKYAKLYRSIYLRNVAAGDDHSSTTPRAAKDVIGYKVNYCDICGDAAGVSSEVMTSADVDWSYSTYGAKLLDESDNVVDSGVTLASSMDDSEKVDGSMFIGHNNTGSYYKKRTACLPKVNYALYSSVTFPIKSRIAYSPALNYKWTDSYTKEYTLTITNSGVNKLSATLSNAELGSETKEFSSANIYNGVEGLPIYFGAAEWFTGLYVSAPTLVVDNHESTVTGASLGKIGYKSAVCSVCGKEMGDSSEVMTSADVDYSKSLYGAGLVKDDVTNTSYAIKGEDAGSYATANTIYVGYTGGSYYTGRADEIRLPLVNYSLYSSVSFPVTSRAAYNLNLSFGWKDPCESASFVLTITNNGENNLTLTLSRDGVEDVVKAETSSDVYVGNKGVSLYYGASEGYTGAFIGLPTLTVK